MRETIVVSETKFFTLRHLVRPHKQWFEVVLNIGEHQLRWNQGNLTIDKTRAATRELNEIFDYFAGIADETATLRWRFWTRATAEEAITYARLKWE